MKLPDRFDKKLSEPQAVRDLADSTFLILGVPSASTASASFVPGLAIRVTPSTRLSQSKLFLSDPFGLALATFIFVELHFGEVFGPDI